MSATTKTTSSLPTNVTPTHYSVQIFDINIAKNSFSGIARIQFEVNDPTTSITLNQKGLTISEATAYSSVTKTRSEVPVKSINADDAAETVTFVFDVTTPFESGQLELDVTYSGKIRSDDSGFRKNADGTVLLAKFQPAEARSAFPCYDQADTEATFDISLVVDKETTANSSVPVLSSKTLDDGKKGPGFDKPLKVVQFETTPKIAPHLVFWSIGDDDSTA